MSLNVLFYFFSTNTSNYHNTHIGKYGTITVNKIQQESLQNSLLKLYLFPINESQLVIHSVMRPIYVAVAVEKMLLNRCTFARVDDGLWRGAVKNVSAPVLRASDVLLTLMSNLVVVVKLQQL